MTKTSAIAVLLLALGAGCAAEGAENEQALELDGDSNTDADSNGGADIAAVGVTSQPLVSGKPAKHTALYADYIDASMFQWAAADAPLLRVIPEGAVVTVGNPTPRNGYYQVVHAGTWGWIHGSELSTRHGAISGLSQERSDALKLMQSAMGFSYWWSNARWSTRGPTYWPSDNVGSCEGNCPKCDHMASGSTEYGSDCSGLVSTVWGFPDTDPNTNEPNDGFATKAYAKANSRWSTITLSSAITGDAVVKNGSGHIFLVGAAPSGGYVVTYECVGCSVGCKSQRRRTRSLGDWTTIRRNRWPTY